MTGTPAMKYLMILLLALFANTSTSAPYKTGDTPLDALGKSSLGEEVRISDYYGKVVIVSFWATWCGPCMKELPVLGGIQKSATTEQLQVISINYREDRRQFRKIAKALSNTDMVLISDAQGKIGKKFGVEGIPHMVIIGRDGKVADVHIGYSEAMLPALVDQINEIARRPAAEPTES
ncbi:TlpA family protein disulfide reductase [Cellvibrio japonicus]|nr:TlpA family protein disulfide reductase [Cellvibrio japonicus]QEI15021.1 TlpA family protein disulfide reductase [Cellvibrio japonicus]QEI18601.1 TlpA family protein disulfide reductase [Cellvibrio japonicus]